MAVVVFILLELQVDSPDENVSFCIYDTYLYSQLPKSPPLTKVVALPLALLDMAEKVDSSVV